MVPLGRAATRLPVFCAAGHGVTLQATSALLTGACSIQHTACPILGFELPERCNAGGKVLAKGHEMLKRRPSCWRDRVAKS